jgi:hypothetical protein
MGDRTNSFVQETPTRCISEPTNTGLSSGRSKEVLMEWYWGVLIGVWFFFLGAGVMALIAGAAMIAQERHLTRGERGKKEGL